MTASTPSIQSPWVTHLTDNLLLSSIIFTAFHVLMWLGEITQPDDPRRCSLCKVMLRHTVALTLTTFLFHLPSHKTDHFYHGSTIVVKARVPLLDPHCHFIQYLTHRDSCFVFHPQLWLHVNGHMPTYSWVIQQLKLMLSDNMAGHSLCSGRATALALASVRLPNDRIQVCGHWSSDAYCSYIRKHPVMLQALLHGQSAFDNHN